MARGKTAMDRMRTICLALPDAEEMEKWGKPHFCVKGKIFAGCGEHAGHLGTPSLGFKLAMDHQSEVVRREGWHVAPYVGKHGWVSVEAGAVDDWDEISACVLESYMLIAPKRSIAKPEA